jgi:hypothetical protein
MQNEETICTRPPHRSLKMLRAPLTGLILVEAACAVGPRRVELPTPQPLAPRQQLEVWRGA